MNREYTICKSKIPGIGAPNIYHNVCPMCCSAIGHIKYNGSLLCDECYIQFKMKNNVLMDDNTFIVTKDGERYIGVITGYQHRIGYNEDKFYIYLNVNEENYSIWYDGWMTEKELAKICVNYKINIPELLK